jgi:2-aminoadipate transaminase
MSLTIAPPQEEITLSSWAQNVERSALQEMLTLTAQPDIISFALGLPAAELFPRDNYADAVSRVLAADNRALQYGPPCQLLKKHVQELMQKRGVTCRMSQIFLTTGAQQGLSLMARVLLNPGSQVLFEEMSYPGFQQVILPFKPQILTVPTDLDTGMDVDAVASMLESGARPAFIYTVTDGHNPLGVGMSVSKRRQLVELARRYQVPIVEDDAYGLIYYGENSVAPMRAWDERWVCYVGSFSKILAPALRVGWLVVPEELILSLSVVKESSDIDTATLDQRAIAAYLDAGHHEQHLQRVRREYRTRRDAMLDALDRHLPKGTLWKTPSSGFFLWVELPESVNASELLKLAVQEEKVAFIPGNAFGVNGSVLGSNCMRLNFSHHGVDLIEKGIARLGNAVKKSLANSPRKRAWEAAKTTGEKNLQTNIV